MQAWITNITACFVSAVYDSMNALLCFGKDVIFLSLFCWKCLATWVQLLALVCLNTVTTVLCLNNITWKVQTQQSKGGFISNSCHDTQLWRTALEDGTYLVTAFLMALGITIWVSRRSIRVSTNSVLEKRVIKPAKFLKHLHLKTSTMYLRSIGNGRRKEGLRSQFKEIDELNKHQFHWEGHQSFVNSVQLIKHHFEAASSKTSESWVGHMESLSSRPLPYCLISSTHSRIFLGYSSVTWSVKTCVLLMP